MRPRRRLAVLWLALAPALGCDGGLEPRPEPTACPAGFVGVCGTVRFRGTIPDNTDDVFVVAYQSFPQSCSDLYAFKPFPPPTLNYTAIADTYELELPSGRYEWVLAVWKKQGDFTLSPRDTSILREAGHYRDPSDPARPGIVTVGGATDSVDFVVDFDHLHPVSDYFACGAAR